MPSGQSSKEFSIAIANMDTSVVNAKSLTTKPDMIVIACHKGPDLEIKLDDVDYIEYQDDSNPAYWFRGYDAFLMILIPYCAHINVILFAESPSVFGIVLANTFALGAWFARKAIFANDVIKIVSKGKSFCLNLSIRAPREERVKLIQSLINELLERRDELRFKQLRERLAGERSC